jgi:hypothetical protein
MKMLIAQIEPLRYHSLHLKHLAALDDNLPGSNQAVLLEGAYTEGGRPAALGHRYDSLFEDWAKIGLKLKDLKS